MRQLNQSKDNKEQHPSCVCGHACSDHLSGYTCQQQCNCLEYRPREIRSQIALSNYRVEYIAPDISKGHTFEPYCAILADSGEFNGDTVRVFDVPDPDENQRAVAQFACDAMNNAGKYERLLKAAKMLVAMNNCNYDRAVMRSEGGFDALDAVIAEIDPKWQRKASAGA